MNIKCRQTRSIGASNSFGHKWSAAQKEVSVNKRHQASCAETLLLYCCQTKDDAAMIIEKNGKDM